MFLSAGKPRRLTATGVVSGRAQDGVVYGGVLTAGSDAASVTIREGGASGTIIMVVKAAAATSALIPAFQYSGELHLTFTGTGPEATVMND